MIQLTKGIGGPNRYGLHAGHQATKAFFQNRAEKIVLPSNGSQTLVYHRIAANHVVAGLVQVAGDPKIKLKLRIVDPDYPALVGAIYNYGRFQEAVRSISATFNCEAALLDISIGDVPYLTDESRGIVLKGNYGLLYDVNVRLRNPTSERKAVRLFFSPIGGMAGGIVMIDGRLVETKLFQSHHDLEPQKIQELVLKPNETRNMKIQTIPEPGAYYPVELIYDTLIPKPR